MSDMDVCKCGDYRHQHVDGAGRCLMPNDMSHGFKECPAFQLSMTAAEYAKRKEAVVTLYNRAIALAEAETVR